MELVKIVILIAITTALSVTLTMKTMIKMEEGGTNMSTTTTTSSISNDVLHDDQEEAPPVVLLPSKRVSRFLAEKASNPRAADHCHKDNDVCSTLAAGKNSTCCNNKCVDLKYDDQNCGACKKKCKYTQTCCRGECVDLAYDKRHCGMCNHRCEYGEYCVYGMCSYA